MTRDIKKTNAARYLDERGIEYELIQYEPDLEDLSAERAADDIGMPREKVYKTLVTHSDKTGIIEACLPAGRELDLKALAAASGNKSVTMAAVKELAALTGYVRGGCSPIGGKKAYPVYLLSDAVNHEKIAINAGARGLLFLISPMDLMRVTGAILADIAK
jgi:Cys-tRNA(Pro)/Cys-tRNA(Cys) deacylase